MTGGETKVWCCKEQHCIGSWNVRSVNQGKLEVVKQEMARVNIDILGISELRWTGMGEFNSDDHHLRCCACGHALWNTPGPESRSAAPSVGVPDRTQTPGGTITHSHFCIHSQPAGGREEP